MELLKVKRYAELIEEFARQADELPPPERETAPQKKGTSQKEKKDVIEIIEYFANILARYFYSDYQHDDISIVDSGFDCEQLWLFIECLIKEKKLEGLLSFFERYERGLDSRVDSRLDSGRGTQVGEEAEEEDDDDDAALGTAQKRRAGNRVKVNVRAPASKRRKVSPSWGGAQLSSDAAISVESDDAPEGDHFFDEDEMQQFLDEEEKKIVSGQSGESDSGGEVDLNEFEGDYEEGGQLKYGDFYGGGEEEEEEDDDEEEEEEEDDEEEEADDDDDDDEADEEDDDDLGSEDERARDRRGPDRRSRKERDEEIERELREMNQFDSQHRGGGDQVGSEAEEEAGSGRGEETPQMERDKVERELIEKKHWSLTGEVSAHDRPKNSLLSLNVEIPKLNSGGNDAYVSKAVGEEEDDDDKEEEAVGEGRRDGGKTPLSRNKRRNLLSDEIERVVKQRIQNMLFDDVEKKRLEDLDVLLNDSKERGDGKDGRDGDVSFDHLNFSKSKLSLAEEYTKKYEEEIKSSRSEKKEINLQKLELMNLYKKIIHCCDSLSNDFYIPKPALLNAPNRSDQFASLHIEETVPIILSEKDRRAPEQLFQPGHIKQLEEMHQKEKKAMRKSKKAKRKKKLLHQFGVSELKKRNEHLSGKNREAKGEKESAARYGVGSRDQLRALPRTRYDFAGAISRAQARDAAGKR
ncbi:U3 small nucleolar ribonucleoprotein protein MPP10, putative [Plasmodium vivax]|uniref:U3 small nucleolar ribonucleoprotein protein MPP10, putative n=1 Tax=Plasmodium vivax TaxID=5855 RepID=A0A1G4H9R1_PLAVI|nr:U3 small nucleolar ribonucleoprotein protein MPP10, putative [Plasmodium vivax]